MSKIPFPQARLDNETPPRKGRKALIENNEVLNLPSFTKDLLSQNSAQLEQKNMIKTREGVISNIPRRIGVYDKSKKVSTMGMGIMTNLIDPEALRRRQDNAERVMKSLDVSKKKLDLVNDKLKDYKLQSENLTRVKYKIYEEYECLKKQIDDLDVEINNIDSKIIRAKNKLNASKVYEEKMFSLKFEDTKNQKARELDESKNLFEKEFVKTSLDEDEKGKEEVFELKEQISLKEKKRNDIYDSIDERLNKRKDELEIELKEMVELVESKTDEFSKAFEIKSEENNKSKEILQNLTQELIIIETEINSIDRSIYIESEFQNDSKLEMAELLKELQRLEEEESQISFKLEIVSKESDKSNAAYELSKTKIEKEKNLRRRIQNSIEEHNGKLRTYVKVKSETKMEIKQDENDVEFQNIQTNDQIYRFNKIFGMETNEDIIHETITLTEHILKGVNLALLLIDSERVLFEQLISSTLQLWNSRATTIGRYQKYQYEYSYQAFEFDQHTQNFIDLQNNSTISVNHEASQLEINASIIHDVNSVKSTLKSSSTSNPLFVNLIAKRSDSEKSVISNCLLVELPKSYINDQFKQLLRSLTKSGIELESFYQLIQSLYKNYKTLSLFTIDVNDSNLMKVAKALNSIESPLKKLSNNKVKPKGTT